MAASGTIESRNAEIEEFLLRYQKGDTAAAASLVRTVSPGFARFCLSQGDSPQDLDDIVQEIWLRVHQARHTYRPGSSAMAWLYAIARHARLDAYRRRHRFRKREVAVETLPDVPLPQAVPATASMPEILACLPDRQREVLVMLKGCGMTLEEVARATSSTIGAVKQTVHRAYSRLRLALEAAPRGQM